MNSLIKKYKAQERFIRNKRVRKKNNKKKTRVRERQGRENAELSLSKLKFLKASPATQQWRLYQTQK